MGTGRIGASLAIAMVVGQASAGITTYFDDKTGWSSAAGNSVKLDFIGSGMPFEQIPFDHYIDLGIKLGSVQLPGGCDWALNQQPGATTDGWSASTASGFVFDPHVVNYLVPQHAFAMDKWSFFLEDISASFYLNGGLVASSSIVPPFGPDAVHFFGWVTDFVFDRVVMSQSDPIDNMYVVPGPGSLMLLVVVFSIARRRRS